MKKTVVWIMVLSLVLSFMCTASAIEGADLEQTGLSIATDENGDSESSGSGENGKVNYPYVFEDFETGIHENGLTGGNATTVTHVSDGVNGSAGAALVEVMGATNSDVSTTVTTMPKIGNLLNFSAWVKLDTELKSDTFRFIVYGRVQVHRTSSDTSLPETKEVDGWKEIKAIPAGLKVGQWVLVTAQESWDGLLTCFPGVGYNGIESGNPTAKISEITSMTKLSLRMGDTGGTNDLVNSEDGSVRYYIDDLSYNVISPELATKDDGNIVQNGEFDTNTSGWSFDGSASIVKDAEDPAPDGSDGYVKIARRDNGIFGNVTQSMRLQSNHLYKVSFYAKIIDTELDTTTGGVWFLVFANNRTPDSNGFNTNYPGYVIRDSLTVGEWTKFEFYYLHEYKTFVDEPYNIGIRIFAGTDKDNRSVTDFAADSMKIVDLGGVSNGDFELGEGQVRRNNTTSVDLTNYSVLGWNAQNSVLAQSDDVRPESQGSYSMKVTAESDGGTAWQGLGLDGGASYRLSFWAKGEGLTEEKPLALVLDRAVTTPGGEQESYDVPDYQYITGQNDIYENDAYTEDVKANQEWKLTNEWQYYECEYNNVFPLKDGLTEPKANIVPRLPYLSFDVDGNTAGTSFYIDDMKLERMDKTMPTLSNVEVSGEMAPGKSITFSYDYSGPSENGFVLVKALAEFEDGKLTSFGSFSADEAFMIPEAAIGKDLVFELTPVDQNNTVGKTVVVTAEEPGNGWSALYFDRATQTARAYASSDREADVVFAAYKDGQLTGVETKRVSLSAEVKTETAIEQLATDEADTVKVMLWDAVDNLVPLCAPVVSDYSVPLPAQVFLMGDSLCADYALTSYPQQGWGHYLQNYLHENAMVLNYAQGGRTAETFYHERWPGIKRQIEKGDYVFISFGLNDFSRAPKYDVDSSKEEVYKKYLNLLCTEAEEAGANVIFTTITHQIHKDNELGALANTATWSGYIKEVAAQNNAVCLDINTTLRKIFFYDEALGQETKEKGKESYQKYYLSPDAMERFTEHPISDSMKNTAATYGDWTHVNEDGADLIASVIAEELAKSQSTLAQYVLQ